MFHACARFLKCFCSRPVRTVDVERSLGDDDVLAEKERVMTSEGSSDVLVTKQLTKKFAGQNRKFVLYFFLIFVVLEGSRRST